MLDMTQQETRPAQPTVVSAPALALGAIWAAVVAISVFAPDLVSGSEHQHLPVAAFGTWIWGAVSTFIVLAALLRREQGVGPQPAYVVAAVWVAAAVVSIAAPSMVTGSDPTRPPIASLVAPVAATVLTGLCGATAVLSAGDRRSR